MATVIRAAADPFEGPWDVPSGWRWERLGDLGTWFGGGTPSKSVAEFWTEGTVPWVSAKDMKTEYIDDTEDHVTDDAVASSAAKRIPAGAVLFVMRSGILRHSFPVAVTRREVTINQDLRALVPRGDVHPRFLALYLGLTARDILHECSKDGTTVNSIETSRLLARPVPLPDITTQATIVHRVEHLFAKIEEGERALGAASEGVGTYRNSLINAAVTGELTASWRRDNPGDGAAGSFLERILAERRARWVGNERNSAKSAGHALQAAGLDHAGLPDGWCLAPIGAVTDCLDNMRVPVNRKERAGRVGDVPYYGANGQVGWIDAYLFDEPLVLVVEDETFTGRVKDFSYIVRGKSWVNNHAHVLRAGPFVLTEYLNLALARYAFTPLTTGTTGRKKLTQAALNKAPIALPPVPEQAEIVRVTQDALTTIEDLAAGLLGFEAASLRQSILAVAFRGGLVP